MGTTMAIVIVDDSMTNLVVLKHMAKRQSGRPIVLFSDPATALEHLAEASADLIIVDCEMPGMNGVAFIEGVRQMKQHAATPILMVTHHTEPEIRLRALKAGAADFLSKPVIPEELKLRIGHLIKEGPLANSAA